jgi:hypothetical protein
MQTSFEMDGKEVVVKENIAERALRVFSPKRANARFEDKVYGSFMANSGGYVGASKVRKALKTWNPVAFEPDAELSSDLPTLRSRSFDLIKNDPIGGAAIDTMTTHVVGSGLK